jgi:excisionase family DNA binding protein
MFPSSKSSTDRHAMPDPTAHGNSRPARIECPGAPSGTAPACPLGVFGACGMGAGTGTARDTRGARANGTHAATGGPPARVNSPSGADFASPGAAGVPASVPVPTDDRLWGPAQAATFLGMSESWVYTAARSGVLPAIRLGRAVRFDPGALRAWVRGERAGNVVKLPRCR